MSREEIKEKNLYYTIVGGSFRVQVSEDHPEAVRRDWTSADGSKSGTKYERIIKSLIGFIEDVQFRDSEYGLQMYIMLDENQEGWKPVIALSTASREAEDLMKKLPSVNFLQEVSLRPFNFVGDSSDEVRGMEVLQTDPNGDFTVKVKSYFRDAEKKENINGFPSPEGDTEGYTKDDWKLYFLTARKFLVNYTKEKMQAAVAQAVIDRNVAVPQSAEQEQRISAAANRPKSVTAAELSNMNESDVTF
jgi:hypothetical protein